MQILPLEILIAIIDTLTCNTQSDAYTYTPELKKTLRSLTLVNRACHQWSTNLLYSRVTLTNSQIAELVATLSEATPHAQSLAKRIHSLRLVVADLTAQVTDGIDHLIDAISLLRILVPTLAIQRLFLDTDIRVIHTRTPIQDLLRNSVSCLASLSELTLINQEHRKAEFFWDVELVDHQYDCLLGLQVLKVGHVTIDEPSATEFLFPLVNLKELVLIRPWANGANINVGWILAMLFAPDRALQHLTLVLVEGWVALGLESLTAENLGPAMVPHLDKVDIFSEREPEASRSWMEIGNMIGIGHRWSQ
ncbi:hypothetical protein FRB95_000930 [Tulasnella sp. JGI-2019a]|nr:hypothetical protein FRB95_000930 [Tulasnella sp. JGI-2019a]